MGKYITLDDRLYDYLVAKSVREPEVMRRLREETAALGDIAVMQIGPDQGAFMAFLVELTGARTCLEIGVFTGYSALAVARALPEDGRLIACDMDEDWTAIARRYWAEAGVAGKIDLRLAPALDTLDALIADGAGGTIDFAFIDADKTNYAAYYERAFTLLRPGGLLVFDNVLWSGAVVDETNRKADTEALRALNDQLHEDDRISLVMLPVGDGLTLARKRA
jgi:caffeoyl-CoA O-methyltransferase